MLKTVYLARDGGDTVCVFDDEPEYSEEHGEFNHEDTNVTEMSNRAAEALGVKLESGEFMEVVISTKAGDVRLG